MTRPDEDDRAAVDRAFAEMVAGYHLTADRPAPDVTGTGAPERPVVEPGGQPAAEPDPHWADNHPLFRFPTEPAPERPAEVVDAEVHEAYEPEPLPPLARPGIPALIGWVGIGWAVLVVLGGAFGARFPGWVGWLAALGFLGGFGVLVSRLPRHRPPDAGDGAVL